MSFEAIGRVLASQHGNYFTSPQYFQSAQFNDFEEDDAIFISIHSRQYSRKTELLRFDATAYEAGDYVEIGKIGMIV